MRLARFVLAVRRSIPILGCATLIALGPARLVGQTGVTGRVTDQQTHRPLAAAVVSVRGTDQTATTDSAGRYRIVGVSAGTWIIEVRRIGYRPIAFPDVVVRQNRFSVIDLALEPAPFQLETVEAAPALFPEPALTAGSLVGFSAEEIKRAPGAAGDVSRILQGLPSVAKVNDQSNALAVRGGSPLENLFLVDGIEIPNINHFPTQGSSGGPIGLLHVDLIRDVDFSAGGFGAESGDRLSSALNIRFREGNREGLDAQLDLNFIGFGGIAEGPLGRSGSWIVAARRSYLDLAVKAFDLGSTAVPQYGDYQGKLVVDLGRQHRLGLLAVWADDRFETDLANALENEAFTFGQQDLLQGTTGLTWTGAFGSRVNMVTSAAWSTSRFNESYFEAGGNNGLIFRNRSREGAFRLRHTTSIALRSGTLSVGGDASRASSRYDNRYDVPDPLGADPTTLDVRTTLRSTRAGAFATLAARASHTVSATLGARIDHHSATGNTTLSPRAAVAVRLGTATVATASGGVYYQTLPSVLLAQAPSHRALPDPRAIHAVVGINHQLADDLRFTLEGYHKRYDRLPVDPDQPGLLPVDELYHGFGFLAAHETLQSTGTGTTTGLEALLQKRMTSRFYGQVGASYARSFYRAGNDVRRPRVFDNRVVLTAEGGWKVGGSWDLSARWIYAGGAPYTPVDAAASAAAGRTVLDGTRINASRLPAYHALSIRADRRFAIGSTTLNTFLSVWNAYNRENVAQVYWNPATGRIDSVTQWTLLPVFGIEWEF